MKKPFFHLSIPGASGVSGEPNSEANFDATNAVTDASCEPNCEATVVRPGSAPQEGNALSTPGENPGPPEALFCRSVIRSLSDLMCDLAIADAPRDLSNSVYNAYKIALQWSQSLQQQR